MSITLAQAQSNLDAAMAALTDAYASSSYSLQGRSMARQDLKILLYAVEFWEDKVEELTEGATGLVVSQMTPIDT